MISNLDPTFTLLGVIAAVAGVIAIVVTGARSLYDSARPPAPPAPQPARNYRTSVVSPSLLAQLNAGSLTPAQFLSLAVAESKGIPAQRVVERRTVLRAVTPPAHSTDHTPTGRLTVVK